MIIKSILVVATPFFSYYESVKYSFKKFGINCDTLIYRTPNKLLAILFDMLNIDYNILLKKHKKKFEAYIFANYKNYDAILIFGAYLFSTDELITIKNKTKLPVIFWLLDSIHNFKGSKKILDGIDLYICYNKEDVEYLRALDKKSIFMPLSYDSRYYKKLIMEKKYDIYFIGSLKSRISFLNNYFEKIDNHKYKIRIDGHLSWIHQLFTKTRYPYFYKYYYGQKLTHSEINEMYNITKICLNIQPDQATSGFAIRTFEIYGSGAMQFTNGNKVLLDEIFGEDPNLIYYKDINELVVKTESYLNSYKDSEKEWCDFRQDDKHDFDTRIQKIIKIIDGFEIYNND